MGKTFKNIHASSFGKFDGISDKIPQWIRANGGQYSKDISKNITHLITTKEAFKDNVEAVREAKRLRTIKIVSFDWLEDSLLSKNRRPKRETEYLLANILKSEKKKRGNEKVKIRKREEEEPRKKGNLKNQDPFGRKRKGVKAGTAVSRYHTYTDEEARVTYNATLVRLMQGKSCKERYVVRVYESNREPHVYATHLEYSRIGKQQSQLLTPLKADRDLAVTAFKETFKDKTGKEWEERLDDILPEGKRDTDGKLLPPHQNWFYYEDRAGLLSNFLRGVDAPDGDDMVTVKQDYLDASLQGIEHESAQDGNGERPGSDEPNIVYDLTGPDIEILSCPRDKYIRSASPN
ncbi:BRCT domain protein [Aspergillus eucalypticola CBS 122712]|uniref:BRCT domain protein n=1 Tax=Aspergillus eucalypticola (strain CBS 122712 / IBT 29274) TaxID=1448314 RepID=A0A317W3M6_ASPEC|nr:BRCT domain protein [Aspergillus eucalypticola CBS 122712]PWY81216.1 BRCT domain protein [Aspergillus eucalypticola CBS 122712]